MLHHLLSPVRIGALELRNRIAMSAMGMEIVEEDGTVREPVVRYYEERARGGAGLLITENTAAAYPRGANTAREIGVSDDRFLPGLSALADAVHRHGARIAIQLAHHGKVARHDTREGRELLMPSIPRGGMAVPPDLSGEELALMARAAGGAPPKVREATREDLDQLVEDFADAALRARRAGFDAVELHGAHGYIFSEFLSPAANFREDDYGGPLENRARLLCEVIRACKARTGDDFPVWCKLDATEFGTPGGIVYEDAQRTAELVAAAGADAVCVSAYANPMGPGFTEGPLVHREGGYVEYAAGIKARVDVPVIAVGRIEPEQGDRLVRDGKADVIAMGRKLLADPELPRKLAEGRPEDVRPCIYCYVCVAQPFFDRTVRCAVNPVTAHEHERAELQRSPAPQRRRVLVVGGGPAGMEAARVASLRGHEVVLCEQGPRLGGTLRFAALLYEPNERLLRWLETQVGKQDIDVRLGREVNSDRVREIAPDVVVAAVGARRVRPAIPGAEQTHVFDGGDLRALLTGEGSEAVDKLSLAGRLALRAGRLTGLTSDPGRLRQASRAWMPVGERIVIVGGGLVGVEMAEFMADRGRHVVVLEEGPVAGLEMAHPRRWRVLHDLRQAGVRIVTRARPLGIGAKTVRFEVAPEGGGAAEGEEVPADSVILATGLEANPGPVEELRRAGVPVVVVGDADGVSYLEGAIHSAFRAAAAL
jgi:2,4-dienoyl-CoA reductase-like NADH-dependent reductase (Old Yellow Enzyme family)/thioredoxin reductase